MCVLQMLNDHLIQSTVMVALEYAINNHPGNPKSQAEKRQSLDDAEHRAKLAEVVIHDPTSHGAPARQNNA